MDHKEGIVCLIIETTKERCEALSKQLGKNLEKQYPSDGPYILIRLVHQINETIKSKVASLDQDEEVFSLLTERQIQQRINRYAKLLPFLHDLLALLDGAEIKDTPSPLVPALRQLTREYIPNAELVLASKSELNYSFIEVGKNIKDLLSLAGLGEAAKGFPDPFIVVTFPAVESDNILLHSVIAHEIGHGIYQRQRLSEKLLPTINIDKKIISTLAAKIFQSKVPKTGSKKEGSKQLYLYPSEVEIQAAVAEFVNTTIENWIEELTSDAIALALFGPAYFFAIIHLVASFQLLDNPSPPP